MTLATSSQEKEQIVGLPVEVPVVDLSEDVCLLTSYQMVKV